MKVKDISRTANIAWSPTQQYPIYLAAGTAAQQLDATFSTNAALEVFALNLSSGDMEMPLRGSVPCEHRFHKLAWGPYGMGNPALPAGLLVGGTDSGSVVMYNANKIINGDKDNVLFCENEKHTGPVQALDFNPFQPGLLATGASDSEIYIWDLNNPTAPLTPGNKSLPPDIISCLSWNRQVQHILASTSPCGRCVVWDLRKNEPIIKVSDNSAMIRCKAVEWHPDVATQMVMASEDDRSPVIQMWDLRFATSPMKVLEGHQRGILSIAWCPQDPDLLMSCAKDNRILCWNPNVPGTGGEIVYELPTTAQWSFDVRWCPRNPAMICTSSFDGHVSVYSLMGGSPPVQEQQKVNNAFDVDDPFAASIQQSQQSRQVAASSPLKKPPKWLRRPCGASFGFGGKLISFCENKESPEKQVQISQVTTEAELVQRSNELEGTLAAGSFIEYCNSKIENSTKELEKTLWSFLKNNFEKEPRRHFLTLLGYDPVELSRKVASADSSNGGGIDAAELAKKMQLLTAQDMGKTGEGVFSSGATTPSVNESKTPLSDTGSEAAAAAAFDAIASSGPLTINTFGDGGTTEAVRSLSPFEIPTDDDTDGLISQALLTGNFEAAVEVCVKADRMADAFLLAIAGGPDLLSRIQKRYFENNKSNVTRLMSVVINRDWRDIVESCVLENWREALAALVTYAKPEEFTSLCDLLGQRLEREGDEHCTNAMVCYICAGNVDKFVACWARTMPPEPSPLALQELIEKVMILKKAVERERRQVVSASSDVLVEKLSKYADLLAAQGCLETAMSYLMTSNDQTSLGVLKDRLYNSQYPNHLTTSTAPPPFPYQRVDVLAEPAPQKQVPVQQPSQRQAQQPYTAPGQQMPPQAQQPYAAPGQQQQLQPQQQVSAPVPSQQPFQPVSQPSFYNPAAYQPQAPQLPPSAPVGQSPYYSQSTPQTPPQPSWSDQQPPTSQYQPQQAGSRPPLPPTSAPYGMQPQPTVPAPQVYNPQLQPVSQPQMPQIYNPPAPSTFGPPGGSPVAPPPSGPPPSGPPPTGPPPISGAWTDAHAVRGRKPHQPTAYTPPAPITAPIFGTQDQQQPQAPTGLAPVPQGPPGPGVSRMVTPGGAPPGGPPSYTQPPPPAQQQVYDDCIHQTILPPPAYPHTTPPPSPPPVPQEPAREVMKGPIPAKHIILQETFDSLVQRCRNTVNNPQTKRKLDDVTKRLEALYDKLRDQKLSNHILENLHEIAQACQAADYPRGLMAHTSLISSGSFSEISTFMPGLKAMMQIATQLRV